MSQLVANIILFGRVLRAAGLKTTPAQIALFIDALRHVGLQSREDVREAGRAILTSRQEHGAVFDAVFDQFWRSGIGRKPQGIDLGSFGPTIRRRLQPLAGVVATPENSPDSGGEQQEPQTQKHYTYSARERLQNKDFAELTESELIEIRQLMQAMRPEIELRRTRRKVSATRGRFLDMRRTLRQNERYGGELIRLAWRRRRVERRPLVLLCDISGSMEGYSRLLLEFLYGVTNRMEKVEAFVFGTRLTRITRQLRTSDVNVALRSVAGVVKDWGGGTRIGEALKSFNFNWGRRVLGRGAVAIILSDGWDRGDAELLEREMDRLRRSCHRLVWLNPLLGSPGYEPLTRGMATALPHVHEFLPVHNLRSLEELGAVLKRLSARPGPRAARRPLARRPPIQADRKSANSVRE